MKKIKRREKSTSAIAKDISKSIRRRSRSGNEVTVEFLSSGCTTANLALSNKGSKGGWARGRVGNIVGDGSSGKTLLALELMFWCFQNVENIRSKIFPKVKKIILVYNNREGVMDFPIIKMYGKKFKKGVEWTSTRTVEKMGRDFLRRLGELKKGEFLLYVADSWDSFNSKAGDDRMKESIEKDEEVKGSYNTEKQKWASTDFFPYCSGELEKNKKDATLLIISQIRTKIGTSFGKKSYRAGGKALDFYTHQVAWIREVEKMRKTKKKSKRVYGIQSELKVERSKVAKPFRESQFTILYDYGLDDVSSMINFLWGKGTIRFKGKKFKKRDSFIKYIEKNNLEPALILETEAVWNEIERSFEKDVEKRKRRF